MNKNGFNSLNGTLDTTIDASFVPPLDGKLSGTLDAAPLVVPEALTEPPEIPNALKQEGQQAQIKPLRGEVSGVTEVPGWDKAQEFTEKAEDQHLRGLITDDKAATQHSLAGNLVPKVTANDEKFSSRHGKLAISVDDDLPPFLRSGSEALAASSRKQVELDDDLPSFMRTMRSPVTPKSASTPETVIPAPRPTLSGEVDEREVPQPGHLFRSQTADEARHLMGVITDGGEAKRSLQGTLDSKASEPASALPKNDDYDYLAGTPPAGDESSKYTVADAPWRKNVSYRGWGKYDISNLPPDYFDNMTPEQQKAWSAEMWQTLPMEPGSAPSRDETDYVALAHNEYGKELSLREKLAAGRTLAVAGINAVFSRPAVDAAAGKLGEGLDKAKDKLAEGAVAAMDGIKLVADKMREAMTSQTKKIADTKFGKKLFTPEGMLTKTGRNVFAVGTVATGLLVLGSKAFLQYKYQVDFNSGSAAPTPTFDSEQTGAPFTPAIPHIGPTQTTEVPTPEITTRVPEVTTRASETPQVTSTVPTQETSVPVAKTPILDDMQEPRQPLPNEAPLSKGPDLIDQPAGQPHTFERPATIRLAPGETVWGRLQGMMPPNSTNQDMINEVVRFFEANKLPIDWDSDDPFWAARTLNPSQVLVVPK